MKIGIDVGGTFTDFLVMEDGKVEVYKVLSTPDDPSVGLFQGFEEMARARGTDLTSFVPSIDTIVHGTTVTTNVVLTGTGARTGLLTTEGVRDALEMRRGIREEQYNNRFTNVRPLVQRHLRVPVKGRLDREGAEVEPLELEDVRAGISLFRDEGVEAVAVCFMNAFCNADHEQHAAEVVRELMPGAYLTVSTEILPSIRFYDRVSTTVLNSYVGPVLRSYLERLLARLRKHNFGGVLLIMQSNGGVVAPEIAIDRAAMTLLSGPAAGPNAGIFYASTDGYADCITVDMGGTSFDAALVRDGQALTVAEGEIDRRRLALPMLEIVTIGAGGGSIGWLDEGGLLRMGPQSAGARPGPVCYGRGGAEPTSTDADLVLGYLDADFFAGGRIRLDPAAARRAIEECIADPLGLSVTEAAAGMYRVINTSMAHGVREVTIKRGFDPREFPVIVAGGAGPLHACMICEELEIPLFLVPRESSIFCAAGMLMTDLKHDFVQSYVTPWTTMEWERLGSIVEGMMAEGRSLLGRERIPDDRIDFDIHLDLRYLKQYHEVSLPVAPEEVRERRTEAIAARFHAEHNRLYGYSLEEEGTALDLINVRLRAIGRTDKPVFPPEPTGGPDCAAAVKGERAAYLPEAGEFETIPVLDGHRLRHGNFVGGPALVEQVNTTLFVSAAFDMICDPMGTYVVYRRDRADRLPASLRALVEVGGKGSG